MSVKIGHASIDENGKIKNGVAGDQTKKEVYTRNWYNKPWTSVIRPKNANEAEKIARAMEQACANDNIGYDQYQRTTLFTQAKAKNWDLSKINVKCETDCSALVAVCVNCAGISVSKDMYTGNELQALKNTGKFVVYTSSAYISSSTKLKRGDILLGKGHTAIVLSDGSKATIVKPKAKIQSAKYKDGTLAGSYKTTSNLNLRTSAGKKEDNNILVIPKGTKVQNYGYYNLVGDVKWLLIQVTIKGVKYTGYSSSNYLSKV